MLEKQSWMWIRWACITVFPAVCAVRFCVESIPKNWVRKVESYGGLFYRIAGPLELILARAREKGQSWLKGQSGSRQLYHGSKQAA